MDHPTISSPEQGYEILYRFKSGYSLPTASEGFNRILRIRPSDHPSSHYTKDDLEAILTRIANSEPPKHDQREILDYFGSRSPRGRGNRGNWRGNRRGYSGGSAQMSNSQKFNSPARRIYPQPNWRTPSPNASLAASGSERSCGGQTSNYPDQVRNDGQGLRAGYNALQDDRLTQRSRRESQSPSCDNGREAPTQYSEPESGTGDRPIIID